MRISIADILTILNRRNFCTIFSEKRPEISTIQDHENGCSQNAHGKYFKHLEKIFKLFWKIGYMIQFSGSFYTLG